MTWFTEAVDTAEDAPNAIAEVVSDIVETIGKAIEDATSLPRGTPALGVALAWLGGVVAHALDIVGVSIKGLLGIVGGVIGGVIRMVGGVLSLNGGYVRAGLVDIGSSFAGAIILVVAKMASLVQSIILVEARERQLTAREIRLLRRVFRNSVAYYNVRLVEGRAGLFGLNPRPFALGNTIYLKDRDVSREPDLLVHECTHVWQYQKVGARYTSDALGAQWLLDDAYDWEKEVGRGKDLWARFNKEAQASFLQDAYIWGEIIRDGFVVARGGGAFFDADGESTVGRLVVRAVDHTTRADTALAVVRRSGSARLSGALGGRQLPMLIKGPE
jgi:hypothetical protein